MWKWLDIITGPSTHSVEGQYCFDRWRLSSSVVVFNTLRRRNVTHPGAARDGEPVVLSPDRVTPCWIGEGL